jgi:hypothetical protein
VGTCRAIDYDHEPVDAVVDQALAELELAPGLAVGVGHERAERGPEQLALDGAHELLVPEVGQAPDEQPDHGRRPSRQGARDRVGLVAQLFRGLADPPLGLGRDLHAAQRVAHGSRREARVLGELADRGAMPRGLGHVRSLTGLTGLTRESPRVDTGEAVH